ncbi:MAG: DUF4381 domain-containing protein [Gammaproteobacteria bacterium]|jgi:hypothetical protein|nr:DUF4381 domain-containing protein [Gammaproteobacteria bacterium]
MVEDVHSTGQLIDIISPSEPLASAQSATWLVVVAMTVLAMAVWAIWRWYSSERRQTMRQLKQLFAAYKAGELSARDVIFWLAAFLKARLRINHLSPVVALPMTLAAEQYRWQVFLQRLHETRYSPRNCSEQDVGFLFTEAKYWMRRWP